MTDLKQAAQQALEALECLYNDTEIMVTLNQHRVMKGAITALRAALAAPEQPHDLLCVCGAEWDIYSDGREELVAAPTPRRPLTYDELEPLCEAFDSYDTTQNELVEFARAIERAHGIGEQHE